LPCPKHEEVGTVHQTVLFDVKKYCVLSHYFVIANLMKKNTQYSVILNAAKRNEESSKKEFLINLDPSPALAGSG